MVKYYCNFCGAELTRETTCRVGIPSTGAFTFSHRMIHLCTECLKNTLGYTETQKIEAEKIMREKRKAECKVRNETAREENGL